MLRFITTTDDALLDYVRDDPVRPEIPRDFRVAHNRFVIALDQGDRPSAMVCVSLHDFVPSQVSDLSTSSDQPNTAIFYTIWSYEPGAGALLLRQTVGAIRTRFPNITRFVTLSPKTEMARRFHTRNGAGVLRENPDTVNYEYHNL
jgi:hypothetical protein